MLVYRGRLGLRFPFAFFFSPYLVYYIQASRVRQEQQFREVLSRAYYSVLLAVNVVLYEKGEPPFYSYLLCIK